MMGDRADVIFAELNDQVVSLVGYLRASDLKFIDSIYALEVPSRSSDMSVTPLGAPASVWTGELFFGATRLSSAMNVLA
jgi:hypothetical protein